MAIAKLVLNAGSSAVIRGGAMYRRWNDNWWWWDKWH
jgi:hypothetical protein